MPVTYTTRLLGGRDVGVTYDAIAGGLSIMGQSISISSLPAALQQRWQDAVANTPFPKGPRGAFGGDNIGQAVGEILDNQPAWRRAVQTALDNYVKSLSPGNLNGDVETFNRI